MERKQCLEEIMGVYLSAKKDPQNPQDLTSYVINYMMTREAGLNHKVAIQKLEFDYKLMQRRYQ